MFQHASADGHAECFPRKRLHQACRIQNVSESQQFVEIVEGGCRVDFFDQVPRAIKVTTFQETVLPESPPELANKTFQGAQLAIVPDIIENGLKIKEKPKSERFPVHPASSQLKQLILRLERRVLGAPRDVPHCALVIVLRHVPASSLVPSQPVTQISVKAPRRLARRKG